MAAVCTQEAILCFLKEKGGKVKNTDLLEHFKAVFPEDPAQKAAVRNNFKTYVDNVAVVRSEEGVKYVCLRKKLKKVTEIKHLSRQACDVAEDPPRPPPPGLGSGYGNDKQQVRAQHDLFPATGTIRDQSRCHEFVCIVEEVGESSGDMGNIDSFIRGGSRRESRRGSKKEQVGQAHGIPEIAVIEASPLPAEGSMFVLPGPAKQGSTGQADTPGFGPRDRQTESLSPEGARKAEASEATVMSRNTEEGSGQTERKDEGDTHSLSGSEGDRSPTGSRKHFIEVMMSSSPQVRRSLALRNSFYLPSKSDSDSLVSSNPDEDRTPVTLDPLEHEWMMCASDGEWGSLFHLLETEPALILRKDFVTGFTCLHWAAKHGKPELIALIINFAKQHDVPISVDVRSNTGYTPLHVAAMHNHMEVVKLLVGAYNADVEMRDYSGRKACQYLTDNVSVDIQDIIGAYDRRDMDVVDHKDSGRWRFSKALQSNLKPLKLNLNPNYRLDGNPRPREKPVRRKSTLAGIRPKLHRLRVRTSQIVHSTSFQGVEDLDVSMRGSFRSRPKTHFFGLAKED